MMNDYAFEETNSRTVEVNGEQKRRIDFNGIDPNGSSTQVDYLNISGRIFVDVMEYFQAGLDGRIPELISEKVSERLNGREEEPTENAE